MLKPGDRAPELTLNDQHGRHFSLSSLIGHKNAVLFFYPRANSAVCTLEACAFRDHFEDFAAADTEVIGISTDDQDVQFRFAQRWDLPFILLSDPEEQAARDFGIGKWIGMFKHRITFVIGRSGRVTAVIKGRFLAEHHVRAALAALKDHRSV